MRIGDEYTNEAILKRIEENIKTVGIVTFHKGAYYNKRKQRYHLTTREDKIKRAGGLKGLYLHYCYMLGYLPRYHQSPAKVHYLLRDDLLKIDNITKEVRLLCRHDIQTDMQLMEYMEVLQKKMEDLTGKRNSLRNKIRRKDSLPERDKI